MSSTFASRRNSARGRATEGSENDAKVGADLPAAQVHSRSPLISIQDPYQVCSDHRLVHHPAKGGGATPKSGQTTPVRPTSRGFAGIGASISGNSGHLSHYMGARDRAGSSRVMRAMVEAKDLTPVVVPHYELRADSNFWKDHNVQVLIRIRPLNEVEIALQGYKRCLVQESAQTVEWTGHPGARFTFDHVACETTSQENLFQVVGLPMVENCMSGYNSCMFAYGQTGSGKTYTMMGEIGKMDNMLSQDCGITPRIFEYLFTRIREEENSRSSEKLRYNCKCSFLEIYNEQITDLLEPSSTNLQLREDIDNGVYVENLKEHEVSSVKDVMELLLQGAANRKMAATYMNSESSRSHSVFTCVIESRWEKDSMSHLRFGRLNLVDLAGSERQKSSGAEGERLKEAANINRSLSTLGLVIMTLVDIANGKNRHVPYRDSRLTFLLQDSLGGNSKTTIVANISPSICSMNETLSTLKFAQRAKLIQNNAKVNEGTSGDVLSLQQQIQKLKDMLALVMNHQNVPKSLCPSFANYSNDNSGGFCPSDSFSHTTDLDDLSGSCLPEQKIKYLEDALSRALGREKMAEAEIRRLEAEIKHSNSLVQPKENGEKCLREEHIIGTQTRDCYGSTTRDVYLLSDPVKGIEGTPTFFLPRNADKHANLKEPKIFYNENEDDHILQKQIFTHAAKTDARFKNDICELLEVGEWRGSNFAENSLLKAKNEELNDQLCLLTDENSRLREIVVAKDAEICAVSDAWEKAVADLTQFLIAGCKSLEDASEYIESLKSSFPLGTLSFNEHVERAIKVSCEKEMVIADLQERLEAAKQMSLDLELKLDCLKGATLAITEVHQLGNERNNDELCFLSTSACENDKKIQELEILLNSKEAQRAEAESSADAAFSVIKKLYDMNTMEQLDVGDIKFMIREILHEDSLKKNQSVAKEYDPAKSNSEIFNIDPTRWSKLKMFEHDSSYSAVDIGDYQEPDIEDSSKLEGIKTSSNHIAPVDLCGIVRDLEAKIGDVHAGVFGSEKPKNVMRELVEKKDQADRLLLKFDEAQEAMEEAEHMLKILINANEDLTIERDWWRKVSQEELAAKILLMEELHRLEASKSSAQMQYQLFQDQISETIEDMSDQISSLKLSFQHIEKIIAELSPFLANALTFGKELLGCIDTSRSFLKDVISETMGKDDKLFVLYQCHIGAFLNQIKKLSLTSLQLEHFSHFTASPTPHCTHMNILQNNEIFKVQNMLLDHYQTIHSNFENSMEVLNVSEEVAAMAVTPGYSKLNGRKENDAVLEEENVNLKNDMNLAHEMIIKLAANCSDFIVKNLDGTAQTNANIHLTKGNSETDHAEWQTCCKDVGDSDIFKYTSLLHDILQENAEDCLNGEDGNWNEMVTTTTTDIEVLYNEIQQLKHKCLLSLQLSKEHEEQMLCQKNKVKEMLAGEERVIPLYDDEKKMASCTMHAKTEFGYLLRQRINELSSKFHNLSGFFTESSLQSNSENLKNQLLLKNLLESVSVIEEKVLMLLKQWSRNVVHAHELIDYFSFKKELARKDGIIEGLLFDLRLLQESTSSFQDMKVKMEETSAALDMVQKELEKKHFQLADALSHQKVLEEELAKSEVMLSSAISEMEHAKNVHLTLSEENSELRVLLESEQVKKNHIEELLEEKNMVIDGLEKEIISVRSSAGAKLFSSLEDILDELEKVRNERDNLQKEMCYLNDRLEMAITSADEKEAIAVEAHQVAEENKAYAQEKEEEIKILEHSIEELEATIDVLERKVSDTKDEVQSHHSIRKQLELEVEYMIERLYKAENDVEKLTTDISCSERECLLRRRMDDSIIELFEARGEIKKLEMEIAQKNEEIKQYEKYVSELVLHSEAQSSLYQDKFKSLNEMILDVKNDASSLEFSGSNVSKVEKNSARTRGSRSPFRCISSLVQQMNLEKDHELSLAKHRIEELEALATSRQKEICELTARLASVDNMTHDVIRDLLGVKLDLTKYANLIGQDELQKLVTRAHEIKDETDDKDIKILNMEESINKLMDERKSLLEEINQRRADMLAQQVLIEQLRQRDQLMTAKNEILKMDKSDLQRRIVSLDERATKLSIGSSNARDVQTTSRRPHEH